MTIDRIILPGTAPIGRPGPPGPPGPGTGAGAWAPDTEYVANQVVQAPDGSMVQALDSHTSAATFAADAAAHWQAVAATPGTKENGDLSATFVSVGTTSVDVAAYGHNLNAAITANPSDGIRFLLSQPLYTLSAPGVLGAACVVEGVGPAVSEITIANGVNGPVIRGKDFATLTGKTYAAGDINAGAAEAELRRLIINGNKANQASGWGIEIWGRSLRFQDVTVHNCKSGGIYTEFTTHPDGSLPSLLEAFFDNIKTQGNDGDGWRFRGPHDSVVKNLITVSNAGWGFKSESAASGYTGGVKGSHWNSWLNANSFYFGGAVDLSHADATGVGGTGVELVAGGGGAKLTAMTVSGHAIGAILRGTDITFSGLVQNAATTGVQIGSAGVGNEGGRVLMDIVGSNLGKVLDLVNVSGPGIYKARVVSAATLINGFGSGADTFDMWSDTASRFGLPGTEFSAAGWNPKFPASNGTLRTDDTVPILVNGSRQTLPAAGVVTADDIRAALITLGLCK